MKGYEKAAQAIQSVKQVIIGKMTVCLPSWRLFLQTGIY